MNTAFIICGGPGAGKTTYGKKLAAETGAVFLDIDMSTEKLVQRALLLSGHDPDDRDSAYFKENFREPIYEQLFDIARDNLSRHHVVITGPFTREMKDPGWPEKLAQQLGAPVEVHYVSCRTDTRRNRLLSRANPRDRAKLADWDEYVKYCDNDTPPCFDHVRIESDDRSPVE